MTAPALAARLEAVLLVTDEPVPAGTLASVVEAPTADVETALADLAQDYDDGGRGFELRLVAGGWREGRETVLAVAATREGRVAAGGPRPLRWMQHMRLHSPIIRW